MNTITPTKDWEPGKQASRPADITGNIHRWGAAKAGSFVVGLLMLLGFPIGTITGGFLIYNALQPWPPRHVDAIGTGGRDMRDF